MGVGLVGGLIDSDTWLHNDENKNLVINEFTDLDENIANS